MILIISSKDPIQDTTYPEGLLILESDTGSTKIGDGKTAWKDLAYHAKPTEKPPVEKPPVEEPPVEIPESSDLKRRVTYDKDHTLSAPIDKGSLVEMDSKDPVKLIVPKDGGFKDLDTILFVQRGDGETTIEAEEGVIISTAASLKLKKFMFGILCKRSDTEWYLSGGELAVK